MGDGEFCVDGEMCGWRLFVPSGVPVHCGRGVLVGRRWEKMVYFFLGRWKCRALARIVIVFYFGVILMLG